MTVSLRHGALQALLASSSLPMARETLKAKLDALDQASVCAPDGFMVQIEEARDVLLKLDEECKLAMASSSLPMVRETLKAKLDALDQASVCAPYLFMAQIEEARDVLLKLDEECKLAEAKSCSKCVCRLYVQNSLQTCVDAPSTPLSSLTEDILHYRRQVWDSITTVMVRHIPPGHSQKLLCDELVRAGFSCLFDFLYIPFDFKSGTNTGVAFINFTQAEYAVFFRDKFDGAPLALAQISRRPVQIHPADCQGYEANMKWFARTKAFEWNDPEFIPMFIPKTWHDAAHLAAHLAAREELPQNPAPYVPSTVSVDRQTDGSWLHTSSMCAAPLGRVESHPWKKQQGRRQRCEDQCSRFWKQDAHSKNRSLPTLAVVDLGHLAKVQNTSPQAASVSSSTQRGDEEDAEEEGLDVELEKELERLLNEEIWKEASSRSPTPSAPPPKPPPDSASRICPAPPAPPPPAASAAVAADGES